jgi:hypothetical protein
MNTLLTSAATKTAGVQRLCQTFPTSWHEFPGLIPGQTCSERASELPALVFSGHELFAVEALDVGSVGDAHFKAPLEQGRVWSVSQ